MLESLAPAIAVRAFSRMRTEPALLEELEPLLEPLDLLLVPVFHPHEHVWLMDPWAMSVEPR
jgi:hypothetical protein